MEKDGAKDISQVAHEQAMKLLREYKNEPLQKDKEKKLRELLKKTGKELIK